MVGSFDSLFGRWRRSSAYLQRPGSRGQGSGGKLGVVWFYIAASIWKARNNIVFNMDGFHWEKVMEELKVQAWRINKSRVKGFNFSLSQWLLAVPANMSELGSTALYQFSFSYFLQMVIFSFGFVSAAAGRV
jgi:hypothetical protein